MAKNTIQTSRDFATLGVAPSKAEIQCKLTPEQAIHFIEDLMDNKGRSILTGIDNDALLMAIQALKETSGNDNDIIGKVYCEYDAKIVFKHRNGDATIEPICMHPELEGKIPSVSEFSFEYVQYHTW